MSQQFTHIVCYDARVNREIKLKTTAVFADADACRKWLGDFFRGLEYRSHEPWDEATHGRGILYPVPVQNVKFDPPKFELDKPDPKRISVLIPRKRILKGA